MFILLSYLGILIFAGKHLWTLMINLIFFIYHRLSPLRSRSRQYGLRNRVNRIFSSFLSASLDTCLRANWNFSQFVVFQLLRLFSFSHCVLDSYVIWFTCPALSFRALDDHLIWAGESCRMRRNSVFPAFRFPSFRHQSQILKLWASAS